MCFYMAFIYFFSENKAGFLNESGIKPLPLLEFSGNPRLIQLQILIW
jgi:hypothetical protein